MVCIKNLGFTEFKQFIVDKEVVVFGAGKALESCMDSYFDHIKINLVIDNDARNWNSSGQIAESTYTIGPVSELIKAYKRNKNIICFIDSPFYAYEIVKQLDSLDELEGLACYLHIFIRNTKEKIQAYNFTKGKQCIPKKIHYIWVGKNKLPLQYERNIETWKKYNPYYEIICWNENNYDFFRDEYTREAYKSGSWGFVPNLARLDIVSREGGIYLDVDVEAVSSFDKLLNDEAFFNMGCANSINRGCGFGAIKGALILDEMKEEFFKYRCCNEKGDFIRRQDHMYSHPVLKRRGFCIVNQYQKIDKIAKYPTEVMSPLTIDGFENAISDKTISLHQEAGSWKAKDIRDNKEIYKLISRCK